MDYNLDSKYSFENYKDNQSSVVSISLKSKGKKIIGSMYMAQGEELHPTINLLHGFPGYEQNIDLAQALRSIGYNVFTFHYRGCWGSDGCYSFGNIIEDVQSSLEFLNSEEVMDKFKVDKNRILLIGHSMGGFASLITAANTPGIKAAVSIAGFNLGAFAENIYNNKQKIEQTILDWEENMSPLTGTSPDILVDEILNNAHKYNLINYADKLSKLSLLLIGGAKDDIGPVDLHHTPLVNALKEQKAEDLSQVILDSDHCFSDKRVPLIDTIISWLGKHFTLT